MPAVRPARSDVLLAVAVFVLVTAAVAAGGGPADRVVVALAFAAGSASPRCAPATGR